MKLPFEPIYNILLNIFIDAISTFKIDISKNVCKLQDLVWLKCLLSILDYIKKLVRLYCDLTKNKLHS